MSNLLAANIESGLMRSIGKENISNIILDNKKNLFSFGLSS